MYAIVDIETTGGSPKTDRISEIAIFIHDGVKVIDEFVTLINPERKIPFYITKLTGITNSMVENAPKFYEVARTIVELTENKIFVAHNVSFDYSFIKNEYKYLGYDFHREQLCTVNLSRRLIPGLRSYSLGKLCDELNIKIKDRHRAAGDALATTKLFDILLQISNDKGNDFFELPGIFKKDLHPNFNPETLKKLPNDTGVYYFYNDKQELIYIGKSKNIKTRILTHFRNYTTKKSIEMRNNISCIGFELTGSELIALLKESEEIKLLKPVYNRSQRRTMSHYGIFSYHNSGGYLCFSIKRLKDTADVPVSCFSSLRSAKSYMQQCIDKYQLCQKLCGLYQTTGACFYYEIHECHGACIGEDDVSEYNKRAQRIIEANKFLNNNFFILDKGRDDNELAVVKLEHGKYQGYGYVSREYFSGDISELNDCIKLYQDNREVQQIIRNYLKNNTIKDIIPFRSESI